MKNKFKFTAIFFAIILMVSSFCFATEEQTPIEPRTSDVEQINVTDEAVTTNLENEATITDETVIEEEPEIYEGDLYIFEDTVNMDKLVDGNVYIIGKDVTITGQIAGNLFVMADNLTIGDDTSSSSYNGYVFYNIYALANKATLYSSCYDLYVAGTDVTIEDSFYIYRDLKMGAVNANIYGTVGRNSDVEAKNINLKKNDSSYASIYGKLNYSSPTEINEEILSSCVNGETYFSKDNSNSITFSKIKIVSLFSLIITLLILVFVITIILKLILSIIRKVQRKKSSATSVDEKEKEKENKE